MKKFIILVLLIIQTNLYSQDYIYQDDEIKKVITEGLSKSYNFEFDEAEKIYFHVKKKYPHNPAFNFLMAVNSYWKMFYFNNYHEKSGEYIKYLENALLLTENLEKKHGIESETVFFYLAIHSSFALYYIQNKDNFKAIGSAKKTYDYIREGYPLKEKNPELYFSAGIYDFYREQYPETHPFYKSVLWMFAPGSKAKGIKELQIASQQAVFTKTEALFYLANIYLKYINKPSLALKELQPLVLKYPNNSFFRMKYTEALIATGKYDEGEKEAGFLAKKGQKTFDMAALVFQGFIYTHRGKPDLAKEAFLHALKIAREVKFPVNDYNAFAYVGLARIAISKKEIGKAKVYYKKAMDISDYNSIKEEAEEFLSH